MMGKQRLWNNSRTKYRAGFTCNTPLDFTITCNYFKLTLLFFHQSVSFRLVLASLNFPLVYCFYVVFSTLLPFIFFRLYLKGLINLTSSQGTRKFPCSLRQFLLTSLSEGKWKFPCSLRQFLLTSLDEGTWKCPCSLQQSLLKGVETFDQICPKISTFYFLQEKYTENIDIFDILFNLWQRGVSAPKKLQFQSFLHISPIQGIIYPIYFLFGRNLKVFKVFYRNVLSIIINLSALFSTFEGINPILARFHKILLFLNLIQ